MRARRDGAVVDVSIAVLAGLVALAIYVRSLAPGLLWGDSAEFQFAASLGGFAHPTGYPLYLMLGWLWTHLVPLSVPAFRMNLFSAFWGGLAVALLCLLVMRVIRFLSPRATAGGSGRASADETEEAGTAAGHLTSRLIGLGAALVFTFTPTFWSQAVIAEVYTLHAALVVALLLTLVWWAERVAGQDVSGARRLVYVAALLVGLSLAHHRSAILMLPAAALFVLSVLTWTGQRPHFALRRVALLLLCLLAPLLLYFYIPLRAPHVPYYRLPLTPGESLPLYDSTLAGFMAHVSGSVFSSSLVAPHPDTFDLDELVGRFGDELSINGLLLGALGIFFLILLAVPGRTWRAPSVLVLTGVFFLAQVIFNLFYAIGDIHVFYIPAYLIWIVWMALGAWVLVLATSWFFERQGKQSRRWAPVGAALLAFVALLAFAYRSAVVYWPKVQRAGDDSAPRAWNALLDSDLPDDAILVSNDRDEMVPLWYLAYVEGRRPDLAGLFPLIQPGPSWANVGAVVDSALQTGRPVYLVKPMPGLDVKYDLEPQQGQSVGPLGPAVRVAPLQTTAPAHVTDVVYGDTLRILGYDVAPDPLSPGRPAQVRLYWEPLHEMEENWTTYVQVVDAGGEKAGQSDHLAGGVFYPTGLWKVGERLRDTHSFTVRPDAPSGLCDLIVGLYVADGDTLRQLDAPQVIGEVRVSN